MKKYDFKQYSDTRIYTGSLEYSPDGKQIAHITNESGQFNLWLVDSGGGNKRQLTHYTDNAVRGMSWSPDGKQIAFFADQNGDEQHQIYLIDVETCEITPVTSKFKSQHYVGDFSPDGKILAYAGNADVPTDSDVYLYYLETGEHKRVALQTLAFAGKWSPDGRYMLISDVKSNTNQNIFLLDLKDNSVVNVTEHEGDTKFYPGPWAHDSSGFYVASDHGREFVNLAFYNVKEEMISWVETPDADYENAIIAKNAPIMVWAINDQGRSRIFARNINTGADLNVPPLPLGVISGIDITPDGSRLALVFARPSEAPNLYEFNMQSGEFKALGQSMLGGIDPNDLVEPELIMYETFDGRKIPAWLYKPRTGRGPYPVILSIHGGPEAQERPIYNYNGFYQYMLSRGFGILAPNIRGSTGYGITYQKLIHRDWGGAELKDIEHAAKYLHSLDWVDKNRIAIFGGSFGGFATLSAITRLPQYWAAAVDIVGPSNLVTFAKAVPPTWKRLMKTWVGDPEEDFDFLMERSPISYVDNIKVPLLVIQGAKDPRVVKNESDQMVERIKANGGDVRYYVDENEGHGTTRKENTIKWYSMIVEYLEEQLLDDPIVD